MSTDVEEQLAHYFRWLDQQTGTTLRKPLVAWEPEPDDLLVDLDDASPPRQRRAVLIIAVAALAIAVAGLGLLRTRDNGPAAGPSQETKASWFVIDPTSAYAGLGEGTSESSATDPLACRRYDAAAGRCVELVGARVVNYHVDGGTLSVRTEDGPDQSNLWQTLELQSAVVDIGALRVLTSGTDADGWTAGFETSAGNRVMVHGAPTQTRDTVLAIAQSLTLIERDLVLPIVFGDTVPSLREMPKESVAARYYAGYVDLTGKTPCVGAFGMPWNNEPVCTPVPDDQITVTVASPSPAGTILIAALPATSATATVVLKDGGHVPLDVTSVPGFAPRLVFADLDGAIPEQLIAYDATGSAIAHAAVSSTGGAALGYVPSG